MTKIALEQVEKSKNVCALCKNVPKSSLDIAGKKAAAEEMKIYTDKLG